MRGVDEALHGHAVEPQPVDAVHAREIEPRGNGNLANLLLCAFIL